MTSPMAQEGCVVFSRNYTNAQPNIDAGQVYAAADYYAYGLMEVDEELREGGRVLPSPRCHGTGDLEHTGLYRGLQLLVQRMAIPLLIILLAKLLAMAVRATPCLKDVRKHHLHMQRTGALRKAEVRRMSEGGVHFMVKRVAAEQALRSGGGNESAKDLQALAISTLMATRKLSVAKEQEVPRPPDSDDRQPTAAALALRGKLNDAKGLSVAAAAAGGTAAAPTCGGKLRMLPVSQPAGSSSAGAGSYASADSPTPMRRAKIEPSPAQKPGPTVRQHSVEFPDAVAAETSTGGAWAGTRDR